MCYLSKKKYTVLNKFCFFFCLEIIIDVTLSIKFKKYFVLKNAQNFGLPKNFNYFSAKEILIFSVFN